MESAFQGAGWRKNGSIHGPVDGTDQVSLELGTGLRCVDFGWISSWALSAKHDGRATLNYLKNHPEDDGGIHVVT